MENIIDVYIHIQHIHIHIQDILKGFLKNKRSDFTHQNEEYLL